MADLLVKDGLELVDERDAPIEIYFGNLALDMGIATLPKILPRFWTFLVSDGKRLNDRQYALLLQVLLLRNTQDYELRVRNLPMTSSPNTLEDDKTVLRRLGLVFTKRIYYPTRAGKPPRMQAQRWDMRSLFFNLEEVARLWKDRQNELISRWEISGRKGRKPVYNFPEDYAHEVTIPGDVALDIVKGLFYPVPTRWTERANFLMNNLTDQVSSPGIELPTGPKKPGTLPTERFTSSTPTGPKTSGTLRTGLDSLGHLLKDDEDEEEDAAALIERSFAYFAECKDTSDYEPTAKEQAALEKLLADGFTFEQIKTGIDAAFARPSRPKHFTHCAAIARDLARLQQEPRMPEARVQPETREPEALETSHSPAKVAISPADVIETDLTGAVELYRSAGREITGDLLARFRLMADRCDQAARAASATGGDWLAKALGIGMGNAEPKNLLHYTDKVLTDWIVNGCNEETAKPAPEPKAPRRKTPASSREPAAYEGIREFIKNNGGFPNGDSC